MSSKIARKLLENSEKILPQQKKRVTIPERIKIPTESEQLGKRQSTLTSTNTTVFDTNSISTGAKKIDKIVNKPMSGISLSDRVCSTENLQIGSLVLCAAVAAGAFGTWASKIGVLTASKIVATNLIAFLQPGMTVVGYALKAGMFLTMNALVPLGTALVTISLPIISTIVVTTISVFIILAVVNKMIQKLEEGVKIGMDKAMELPGKLLEQVPGYSMISSLFGLHKPSSSEKEVPVIQKVTDRDEVKSRRDKKSPAIYTHRRDFFPNTTVNGE